MYGVRPVLLWQSPSRAETLQFGAGELDDHRLLCRVQPIEDLFQSDAVDGGAAVGARLLAHEHVQERAASGAGERRVHVVPDDGANSIAAVGARQLLARVPIEARDLLA